MRPDRLRAEFPEYRELSDAECDRLVRAVRERHRGEELAIGVVTAGAAVAVALGFIVVALNLWQGVAAALGRRGDTEESVAACVILGAVGAMLLGSGVSSLWNAAQVRRHFRRGVCAACGYSLTGLPLVGGVRTCPECGLACGERPERAPPRDPTG